MNASIEIYQTKDGITQIEVDFEDETVWLTQPQMASLFNKGRSTITEHIQNIFMEGELTEKVVCRDFRHTTQHGAIKGKTQSKTIIKYNLDVIISVGYRVKSKQGTQFRQWATQRLKDYLIKGFTINEQKLKASQENFKDLKNSIQLLEKVVNKKKLSGDEALGLLKVVTEYSHALDLLDQFDHQRLNMPASKKEKLQKLSYKEAITQIQLWRKKQNAGKLFGNEKDKSFHSSLETIYQTFNGKDLYPGIKEKAANLLYFVVKNHSFSDGNKRIAAGLFVYFLDKNKKLYNPDGSKVIADNALVAITLLIAESIPEEKDQIVKLVANLIVID